MDIRSQVLLGYILIGIFLIVFNKQICITYEKFARSYTKFLRINNFFIFKIDEKNQKNFIFFSKFLIISFGILTILFGIISLFLFV